MTTNIHAIPKSNYLRDDDNGDDDPSSLTMALEFTQPLTEMSTR
jgi:hypothetical protein